MFGKLMHPTVELCLVLIVVSTLFVAQSSIIVQTAKDDTADKITTESDNYKFAVAILVIAVLVLVYGLAFLGMDLFEKYK